VSLALDGYASLASTCTSFIGPTRTSLSRKSVVALAGLPPEGKLGHIGVSNFAVGQLEQARAVVPIISVQNHYNLGNRASEPVLEYCERHGPGFLPYFPRAFGNRPRDNKILKEVAIRHRATATQIVPAWPLKRSPVMIPIRGTSSVAHLEENQRASTIDLAQSDSEKLEASFHG
jgi:pyridoxine 4-dehydrogenase